MDRLGKKETTSNPAIDRPWSEPSTATVRNQCTSTRLTDERRRKLLRNRDWGATQTDCDSRTFLLLRVFVFLLSAGGNKKSVGVVPPRFQEQINPEGTQGQKCPGNNNPARSIRQERVESALGAPPPLMGDASLLIYSGSHT